MMQFTCRSKVWAASCKKDVTYSGEPIGDPSKRVPCCRCEAGERRWSAAGREGWVLGTLGSSVERMVVLVKLRAAPMREPSCWKVSRYGVTSNACKIEETSSVYASWTGCGWGSV